MHVSGSEVALVIGVTLVASGEHEGEAWVSQSQRPHQLKGHPEARFHSPSPPPWSPYPKEPLVASFPRGGSHSLQQGFGAHGLHAPRTAPHTHRAPRPPVSGALPP